MSSKRGPKRDSRVRSLKRQGVLFCSQVAANIGYPGVWHIAHRMGVTRHGPKPLRTRHSYQDAEEDL